MIALVVQMDGVTEQDLHGPWPGQGWKRIHHGLQITQLMGHTKLDALRGRFQLGTVAVAYPYFRFDFVQDVFDHIIAAIETDHMQDSLGRAKHPLPPVVPTYPTAGFVAVDDCTLAHTFLNGGYGFDRLLPRPLHDLVNPTLTDFDPMQLPKRLLGALITHMLFLAVVHHCRFQPRTKTPVHLKTRPWFFHLDLSTVGTGRLILSDLDHLRSGWWQFRDLVHLHQLPFLAAQIRLACTAALAVQIDDPVCLGYQRPLVLVMSKLRSMFMPGAIFALIALLIFGWRLG